MPFQSIAQMRRYSQRLVIVLLASWLLLTACIPMGDEQPVVEVTPTVQVVADVSDGLEVIAFQACLKGEDRVIQTDRLQGDLLAWSPLEDKLAYVSPHNDMWGWYEGDLVVLDLANGERQGSADIKVNGDLTWSPNGERIAFITFRPAENQYSVMVYSLLDGSTMDLYTIAATDEFASRKGIIGWRSDQVLQISETCGIDCVRFVELDLVSGQGVVLEETRQNMDTSLQVPLNQPGVVPHRNWRNANWSPTAGLVFFTDRNGVAWLGNLSDNTKFALPIDRTGVEETKWSPDERMIAVRTAINVTVFALEGCR
ncbi:MAG: hypothetical protein ROW48_15945 [Bellilinea sp.]|jgi:hypothetical protein